MGQHLDKVFCGILVLGLVGCGQTPGSDEETTTTPTNSTAASDDDPKHRDVVNGDGGKIIDQPSKELKAPPKNLPIEGEYKELSTADLIKRLTDESNRTQIAPELATRGTEAIPLLMLELNSDDAGRQAAAAFVLGTFGEKATPTLAKLKQLADSDGQAAIAASFAVDAIEKKPSE
jgi:hypothetical protein